jgi:lincosamide nucleotidyltransferase
MAAALRDRRIVGLLDYGSSSEGRDDVWSDVDAAIFVRDADYAAFDAEWRDWVAQFGRPLVAFLYQEHHPWVVYDSNPIPLRADFGFHSESSLAELPTWPNAPTSVEALVRYDGTGGKLTEVARQLVGKSLAPTDIKATFERLSGVFWYFLLRAYGKLRRGQPWAARYEFNFLVTGLLHALLRMEAGRIERWQAMESPVGIEAAISPERLERLTACIPGPTDAELRRAMLAAGRLGQEAGAMTAAREGWHWPLELGERTEVILSDALGHLHW